MQEYIVRITDPSVREELEQKFEKVGKPRALKKSIIVKTDKPKSELENFPGVVKVDEDVKIEFDDIQEHDINNWALPEICDSSNNTKYKYFRTGKNVDIYIVDTGILSDHVEFINEHGDSRVEDVYTPNDDEIDDEYSGPKYHGTAVASCAAGKTCGVAKEANIKNVRIFGSGTSTVKALDRVLEHHKNKNNYSTSIVNMSFSAKGHISYLDDETKDLVENGIICVGSAGNNGKNKANAPALHSHVICVGSTKESDKIAGHSNYGDTIDILAPGQYVKGAKIESTDDYYDYLSGTSFASPYVSGVCALIIENSFISNQQDVNKVKDILISNSKKDKIETKGDTPNRFIYSMIDNDIIKETHTVKVEQNSKVETYEVENENTLTIPLNTPDGHKFDKITGSHLDGAVKNNTYITGPVTEDRSYQFFYKDMIEPPEDDKDEKEESWFVKNQEYVVLGSFILVVAGLIIYSFL